MKSADLHTVEAARAEFAAFGSPWKLSGETNGIHGAGCCATAT